MTPEIEERARKTACLNSLCENINCRMHSEMLKEIDTLRTQYGDAQMELGELKAEIDRCKAENERIPYYVKCRACECEYVNDAGVDLVTERNALREKLAVAKNAMREAISRAGHDYSAGYVVKPLREVIN